MRIKFWTLGLLAIMVLSACAPAAAPAPSVAQPPAMDATQPPAADPALVPPTQAPAESEPVVVVTPRSDALQATDPSTVNLASGQPQLVEFFRFT